MSDWTDTALGDKPVELPTCGVPGDLCSELSRLTVCWDETGCEGLLYDALARIGEMGSFEIEGWVPISVYRQGTAGRRPNCMWFGVGCRSLG